MTPFDKQQTILNSVKKLAHINVFTGEPLPAYPCDNMATFKITDCKTCNNPECQDKNTWGPA